MTKEQKINKLSELITSGEELKNGSYDNSELEGWKERVRLALSKLFPFDANHTKKFDKYFMKVCLPGVVGENITLLHEKQFKKNLGNAVAFLKVRLEEVIEYGEQFETTNFLKKVLDICDRFPDSLRTFKKRRRNKESYEIKDEYDIQDIFEAYLSLFFDDIKTEDPMPRVGDSSSTIDFLLADCGIGIELKTTIAGKEKKHLKEDLIKDMTDYRAHPGIKQLVFFIYDPDKKVDRSSFFGRELEKESVIPARVIVRH